MLLETLRKKMILSPVENLGFTQPLDSMALISTDSGIKHIVRENIALIAPHRGRKHATEWIRTHV